MNNNTITHYTIKMVDHCLCARNTDFMVRPKCQSEAVFAFIFLFLTSPIIITYKLQKEASERADLDLGDLECFDKDSTLAW